MLTGNRNTQQSGRTPYTPQTRSSSSRECSQRRLGRLRWLFEGLEVKLSLIKSHAGRGTYCRRWQRSGTQRPSPWLCFAYLWVGLRRRRAMSYCWACHLESWSVIKRSVGTFFGREITHSSRRQKDKCPKWQILSQHGCAYFETHVAWQQRRFRWE